MVDHSSASVVDGSVLPAAASQGGIAAVAVAVALVVQMDWVEAVHPLQLGGMAGVAGSHTASYTFLSNFKIQRNLFCLHVTHTTTNNHGRQEKNKIDNSYMEKRKEIGLRKMTCILSLFGCATLSILETEAKTSLSPRVSVISHYLLR